MSDREAMAMARDLVRGSIIEDAASRFISQILREAHDSRISPLRARIEQLEATLKRLEYWFDTDAEILDAMTPDERADHMRQLTLIRETLTSGQSY